MKKWAGMVVSWLLVLALCYIPLEMTALRWLPRVFPLASVINYLDADVQLLAQYSKKNPLPENYIAILGDSYAFGQGDWLYNRQHDIAPVYNTTHLLHEKTGRDVVSFGRPASSNIKGYLEDPLSQFLYLQQKFSLRAPDVAILYFYEGNDVMDNWQDFEVRYKGRGFDPARLQDEEYFSRFIDDGILAQNSTVRRASAHDIGHHCLFGRFLLHLFLGETLRAYNSLQQAVSVKPYRPVFKPQPRDHNAVRVAGVEEKIPDRLQVPPLALQENEKQTAMLVLGQSLRQLQKRWPSTRLGMVYVPAVATSYDVVSETLNIYDTGRGKSYPSSQVLPVSDDTCNRVAKIAAGNHMPFVDARPALRRAARQQFIHGPVDWLHFNEAGYRVLAGEITRLLEQMQSGSAPAACARLAAAAAG